MYEIVKKPQEFIFDTIATEVVNLPDTTTLKKVKMSLSGFTEWLSKRVEKEEEKTKKDKLIALCDKYSQSGFLDNVRDNKEEFINAILDL